MQKPLLRGVIYYAIGAVVSIICATLADRALAAGARSSLAWEDYQIIIWQDQTPARLAGLAQLGVTAGRIFGIRDKPLTIDQVRRSTGPFRAQNLGFYIENIATDFYAAYHRWFPDHPVNWLFDETKRLRRREPANIAAFIRRPSLSDVRWLRRIALRLQNNARVYTSYHPLFFNLADEAGIADLAAAWDFDFTPASLAALRVWLKQQYGTLPALNREWGTRFPNWNAVMPMTTDEALTRADENFSAWADFKEFMDIAFARAVRAGTEAVHAVDPRALVALEGGQPPGWGGYNYSHLATAIDVLEMSNEGNSAEIAHSLGSRLITLTTSSLADAAQIHAVWHELLLGGRGLILWDADNAFVGDDGAPTPRGRILGSLATQLRSGIAAQLMTSAPESGSVAILYSPESQRTQWLLDRKSDGKPWVERESETEYLDDNLVRSTTWRMAAMLTHLGMQPRWVTGALIEQGVLQRDHIRVLLLPHSIAMSPEEARQIRDFASAGGAVVTDSEPGVFDAHSRRLARPFLADLTRIGRLIPLIPELQENTSSNGLTSLARMRQILQMAGIIPRFSISIPRGALATDIDARVFRTGDVIIIGLQRDWIDGGDTSDKQIVMDFKEPVYLYDLLHPGAALHTAQVTLTLDAVAPTLIAIAPTPLPTLIVHGPTEARVGTTAKFNIASIGPPVAAERIVHVEVTAPDGTDIPASASNIVVTGGRATWRLLLPLNDPTGDWTVRAFDVLGGQATQHTLRVTGTGVASPSRQ
jgi:hypothetical protein